MFVQLAKFNIRFWPIYFFIEYISFMLNILKQIAICSILGYLCIVRANIMCNGDFQDINTQHSYNNSLNDQKLKNSLVPNNFDCWYSKNGPTFEVKQINYPYSQKKNKVLDFLSSSWHSQMCQTVQLAIGQRYVLSLGFILDYAHKSAQIDISLNNYTVFNDIFIKKNENQRYKQIEVSITAVIQVNQICFMGYNEVFKVAQTSTLNTLVYYQYGCMIDNVVLNSFLLPNLQITVQLAIQYGSSHYSFKFISNLNLSQHRIHPSVFDNLSIYVDYQQQHLVSFQVTDQDFLNILLTVNQLYPIQSIKSSSIFLNTFRHVDSNLRLIFVVNQLNISFSQLSVLQNRIVQIADSSAVIFAEKIYSAYLVMNTASCSSFILGLIGFYNLSLMYVFLHIKALPSFANNFMYNLVNVFYKRNSLVSKIKQMSHTPQSDGLFKFDGIVERQKIPRMKDKQKWYNYFGMSSNFMINNIQSLLLLSFHIVKYLIFKILMCILPAKARKAIDLTIFQIYSLFIAQVGCFMPFLTISTSHVLTSMAEQTHKGRINNMAHLVMFIVLICGPITQLSIHFMNIRRFKRLQKYLHLRHIRKLPSSFYKVQNNSLDKQKAKIEFKFIKKECIKYNYAQCIEIYIYYSLCLLIPILVVLNNKASFFIITTPLILYRLVHVIQNFRLYTLFQKIIKLTRSIIWTIYQINFILLGALQCREDSQDNSEKFANLVKISGFIIIICLILGGFIDLLKTLFQILEILKKIIKFVLTKLNQCRSNQIQDQQKPKQKQLQNKSQITQATQGIQKFGKQEKTYKKGSGLKEKSHFRSDNLKTKLKKVDNDVRLEQYQQNINGQQIKELNVFINEPTMSKNNSNRSQQKSTKLRKQKMKTKKQLLQQFKIKYFEQIQQIRSQKLKELNIPEKPF